MMIPNAADLTPLFEDFNSFKGVFCEKVPVNLLAEQLPAHLLEILPGTYFAAARPDGPAPMTAILRTLWTLVMSKHWHGDKEKACCTISIFVF
jgi:hypothetical protein